SNRWPCRCFPQDYENTTFAIHTRSRQRSLSSFSLDRTPVRAVRISLAVACISFAIAWGDAALALVHVIPHSEPYRSAAVLAFLFGHLIAVVAIILASIYGISIFVRHREDCSV